MDTSTQHSDETFHGTARAARDISHAAAEAVESIAEPIGNLTSQAVDEGAGVTRTVRKAIKEQAEHVGEGAKNAYRAAKKAGQHLEETAQATIRRTPITTILAAIGVGVVLGFLLGHSSTHNTRRGQ